MALRQMKISESLLVKNGANGSTKWSLFYLKVTEVQITKKANNTC
jgi:hypothetical protein